METRQNNGSPIHSLTGHMTQLITALRVRRLQPREVVYMSKGGTALGQEGGQCGQSSQNRSGEETVAQVSARALCKYPHSPCLMTL